MKKSPSPAELVKRLNDARGQGGYTTLGPRTARDVVSELERVPRYEDALVKLAELAGYFDNARLDVPTKKIWRILIDAGLINEVSEA